MKIVVAQIGARRHYCVPTALARAGLLERLCTDVCSAHPLVHSSQTLLPRSLTPGALQRLYDRQVPGVANDRITSWLTFALGRRWQTQTNGSSDDQLTRYARDNARFGEWVGRQDWGGADAVYGFNAASVELFEKAKARGLQTILDQTMAPFEYVETLLADERDRWPGWDTGPDHADSWQRLAERERREWELADVIVCGSQFVVDALEECGVSPDRCRVVPYGYDPPNETESIHPPTNGKLRVLFLGTIDLRKGVPYLLEAATVLDSYACEFRAVGPVRVSDAAVTQIRLHIDLTGPVPRSAVTDQFAWADVLVLPTLAEGSANVCYEAMAHGVPVITTSHAGSMVRDGIDGTIVPVRDVDALVETLQEFNEDRPRLEEMSRKARVRSSQLGWSNYQSTLVSVLRHDESAALFM